MIQLMKATAWIIVAALLFPASLARADLSREFDRIWETAANAIYPPGKQAAFSEDKRLELKELARRATTTEQLAAVINPFLLSLNVSHTYLYDTKNPDYYFMRSLFSTRKIDAPKIRHIGMQVHKNGERYIVRSVLEGYPAQQAGLRRGDIVARVNDKPFHPVDSFNNGSLRFSIDIVRNGISARIPVVPVHESPHESFAKATANSVGILTANGLKIGYIHLWSGTDASFLATLKQAVSTTFAATDALILDLRDGFGGAWWDYLDPFFPDRSTYFRPRLDTRDGTGEELSAPPRKNQGGYRKPLVVLINEGVRSGKEALAYQFKKTGRAVLVGTATRGAFTAGKGIFADEDRDYLLYLAVGEAFLDGEKIEGLGIRPDVIMPWPLDSAGADDPQLQIALQLLQGKLTNSYE